MLHNPQDSSQTIPAVLHSLSQHQLKHLHGVVSLQLPAVDFTVDQFWCDFVELLNINS